MSRMLGQSFAVLLVLLLASPSSAGLSREFADAALDSFRTLPRAVRSSHPLRSIGYVHTRGGSYAYALSRHFARVAGNGVKFELRDVDFEDDSVRLQLESPTRIRFDIVLNPRSEARVTQAMLDQAVPALLHDLFEFGTPTHPVGVVVNNRSGQIHEWSCGHLPTPDVRQAFASHGEALAAGHRDCEACFPAWPMPPVEHDAVLSACLPAWVEDYHRRHPRVEDEALQASVQARVLALLDVYPMTLVGFDYRAEVVESVARKVAVLPGGAVFVSDALWHSLESDIERDVLLALTIAWNELAIPARSAVSDPLARLLARNLLPRAGEALQAEARRRRDGAKRVAALAVQPLHGGDEALAALRSLLDRFPLESLDANPWDFADFDPPGPAAPWIGSYRIVESSPPTTAWTKHGEPLADARLVGIEKGDEAALAWVLIQAYSGLSEAIQWKFFDESWAVGDFRDGAGKQWSLYAPPDPVSISPGSSAVVAFPIGEMRAKSDFDKIEAAGAGWVRIDEVKHADEWRPRPD